MKFWPLGTIISINGHKMCVIGYASAENASATTIGYFVVSYPIGFTNIKKVFYIPATQEVEVVAEGYKTDISERLLGELCQGFDKIKDMSYEDLSGMKNAYKKIAVSRKERAKE